MKDTSIFKCNDCKDTGKIKYIPIEFIMYSWQPWLEKECSCQKNSNKFNRVVYDRK